MDHIFIHSLQSGALRMASEDSRNGTAPIDRLKLTIGSDDESFLLIVRTGRIVTNSFGR